MKFTLLVVAGMVAVSVGCTGAKTSNSMVQNFAQADAGPLPRFISRPGEHASEGFPCYYRFAARDPKGEALTYQLVRAPEGAVLEGRELVWVPKHRQCGRPQWFILRAVNAHGGARDQTWSVVARSEVDDDKNGGRGGARIPMR